MVGGGKQKTTRRDRLSNYELQNGVEGAAIGDPLSPVRLSAGSNRPRGIVKGGSGPGAQSLTGPILIYWEQDA